LSKARESVMGESLYGRRIRARGPPEHVNARAYFSEPPCRSSGACLGVAIEVEV
jgi:hypothetical protein